ncbi:hypothetical protein COX95_04520 [bacterium CG_4_10_14_0_2_um_filter_33_32]|nr:MAG: hypothetical protein COU50_00610 [bacterium CG10_big_fil_rev_8_21_14_0_10_33_18]PIU76396.1 MAG: hypothetical protein COS74_04275 [bacterium CG06_land_8_20_14_3_00_33_50]PIY85378.1 MAG: hypothetical protein COY76_02460 [bacterium CG_4_10_14_0_8_um_filter_33_57]PIZ85315.1 MAG: hypothetical protein COX95_04520 [bacterium CG_4_10_14_0_2_um_filter_33_32]PJA71735.1 MAG: hypothetical protein CO152_05130 [bacterium CG_4_9_14_3_um_filter_33_26]
MANYQINSASCDGCGKCSNVCSHHACKRMGDKYWIDHMLCNGCGACKSSCPHYAIYYVEGTNMGEHGHPII